MQYEHSARDDAFAIASRQWIVSQLGGRDEYFVARGLLKENALDVLLTDFWCRRGRSLLMRFPVPFRALAGRWHQDLPDEKVRSFNIRTLSVAAVEKLSPDRDITLHYVRAGEVFGDACARYIKGQRRKLASEKAAFFGYCTGALEPLELLRGRGVPTVVSQIHPGRVEEEIVAQERAKWPSWEPSGRPSAPEYWRRLEAEWAAATVVIANSAWSRNALVSQGVPKEKIRVIPLAYEGTMASVRRPRSTHSKLSVLWLGTVCLRKGVQYLLEAARLLVNEDISFTIVGPLGISADAAATAPKNVSFIGRVTRDRLTAVYDQADLFVIPTLSDGFAMTQIEAMAHGLPVIATPCCGEVVQHGVNGLIVPPRDAQALADAILRLKHDRSELAEMSSNAVRRAADFSLSRYTSALVNAAAAMTS